MLTSHIHRTDFVGVAAIGWPMGPSFETPRLPVVLAVAGTTRMVQLLMNAGMLRPLAVCRGELCHRLFGPKAGRGRGAAP